MNLFSLIRHILMHPLNRPAPLRALSRFVRWQISARILNAPIVMPFVDKTRLIVRRGMTGATGNWYWGLQEPAEMAFVLHALREGELFVDVGANVGTYSILAAGVVGANAISIEPIPEAVAALRDNVSLNGLTDLVDIRQCGVSDSSGELRFTSTKDTMNHVVESDDAMGTLLVGVTTIDELCRDHRPRMLKIDVEGHESKVIAGAAETLGRESLIAVIMETNEFRFSVENSRRSLVEAMGSFGFSPCSYDPLHRKLTPDVAGVSNTIFVRDIEFVRSRCGQAPLHQLVNGRI